MRDTVPAPPVKNYNPIGALRVALQQMTQCHWELFDAMKEIEGILDSGDYSALDTIASRDAERVRDIREVITKALEPYVERES